MVATDAEIPWAPPAAAASQRLCSDRRVAKDRRGDACLRGKCVRGRRAGTRTGECGAALVFSTSQHLLFLSCPTGCTQEIRDGSEICDNPPQCVTTKTQRHQGHRSTTRRRRCRNGFDSRV
nr:uncharacterized protein LOC113829930 [Penaeus vannamei]